MQDQLPVTDDDGAARDRARLTMVVRGRVQGVGYRAFTRSRSGALGLDGHVRNLPDGRGVEMVAEGPRAALEQLVVVARQGPFGARVDDADVSWAAATGCLPPFEIR